jgi:hypothetical protein
MPLKPPDKEPYGGQAGKPPERKIGSTSEELAIINQTLIAVTENNNKEQEKDHGKKRILFGLEIGVAIGVGAYTLITAGLFIVSLIQIGKSTDQISIMQDTAQRQLRAYVGVETMKLVSDPTISNGNVTEGQGGYVVPDYLAVSIKNFGTTTAFYVLDFINWATMTPGAELPADFAFEDQPDYLAAKGMRSLQEGKTLDSQQPYDARHPILKFKLAEFKSAKNRTSVIYLWGHVDSCDIYNRKWSRTYAFMYQPWYGEGHDFAPIARHQGEQQKGAC